MKVFKLDRLVLKDYWTGKERLESTFQGGDLNYNVLCIRGLRRYFDVPSNARKLWVAVRKSPAKGFVKVTRTRNRSGYNALAIDGKISTIHHAASVMLHDLGIGYGNEFYVSIEYSLDN